MTEVEEQEQEEKTTGQKYNVGICYAGRPQIVEQDI